MKGFALAFLGLFLIADSLRAQTAKQGTKHQMDTTAFESPMVIELGFVLTDPAKRTVGEWQTTDEYARLAKFQVEGVSIQELSFRVAMTSEKESAYLIGTKMKLSNRPGHDKTVSIRVELFDGGRDLASGRFIPFQVDEEQTKTAEANFGIPQKLLDEHPDMKVRLIVAAEDD